MKRLFKKVTARSLMAIENGDSISDVGRKVESQLTTVIEIIKKFEEVGLIKTRRIGRIREITLTKKGEKVKWNLAQIK